MNNQFLLCCRSVTHSIRRSNQLVCVTELMVLAVVNVRLAFQVKLTCPLTATSAWLPQVDQLTSAVPTGPNVKHNGPLANWTDWPFSSNQCPAYIRHGPARCCPLSPAVQIPPMIIFKFIHCSMKLPSLTPFFKARFWHGFIGLSAWVRHLAPRSRVNWPEQG